MRYRNRSRFSNRRRRSYGRRRRTFKGKRRNSARSVFSQRIGTRL